MPATIIAAVRGAISVRRNRPDDIREASARLLKTLIARNRLSPERVVSAVFTATPDLTADFPAHAARRLGWTDVPLLGAVEIGVPGAPKRIVRVLLTVRTAARRRLIPVYLDRAAALRPDLAAGSGGAPSRAPSARRRRPRRVAIVGLGQIGGSIGLALGAAGGWSRIGFDRRASVARAAVRRGAIDRVAATISAACREADIAVIAVPVDAIPRVLAAAARALPQGAVLLDTGGARLALQSALRAASSRVQAVGGHPIAGNERRGLAGADAGLFRERTFALLPVSRGVPRLARELVRALGARPLEVGAARHDLALARTSHLPWLMSRALARLGAGAARARLAGPGFASMTRLAASDPRVASAAAGANAANVRKAWRQLRRMLDRDVAAVTAESPAHARRAPRTSS
jgi:prephenate dehydrogenase